MRWTRVPGGCGAAFKKARAQGNLGVRVVEGAARFPARRSGGRSAGTLARGSDGLLGWWRHWRAGPVGGVRTGGTALVAGLSGTGLGLGWREEKGKRRKVGPLAGLPGLRWAAGKGKRVCGLGWCGFWVAMGLGLSFVLGFSFYFPFPISNPNYHTTR